MKLPRKPRTGVCISCRDLNDCNMRSSGVTYCAAHREVAIDMIGLLLEEIHELRTSIADSGITPPIQKDEVAILYRQHYKEPEVDLYSNRDE